jgi:hypothetical protein
MHRDRVARIVVRRRRDRHAGALQDAGQLRCVIRRHVEVRRFAPAAEHPHDAALRVHLQDHVRTLVDDPDVVLLVDAHRVRERPRKVVLADFAHELALRIELEQLRGDGHIGRTADIAAREHEHVALRVDRHAGDFAEVNVGRQRQRIGH